MTGLDAPRLPRRVLIANRGEIAVRVARTCRRMGIATVAVFADPDTRAAHVRAGDQAVRIGGDTPATSYLRIDALLDAAARTGADAVHPGYGFLSEHAGFARAVLDAGLTWIGPSPEVIATMGDKVAAKRTMAGAGVPLLPGAEVADGSGGEALATLAEDVGFPLLVKAAAGGGGRGMRRVEVADELAAAIDAARREAGAAFGDDRVFLERLVTRSRHVEVQIVGDATGAVVHAFERECSVQRRHQKVVEEAPSPGLDDEVREALFDAAVTAARTLGYEGAGTIEFLADEGRLEARRRGEELDPRSCIAFLEVNTRLQVEHPVTEATVAVRGPDGAVRPLDLVREQLLVACGVPLAFAQQDLVRTGHAIEARLYAEDPAAGYLPQAGRVTALRPARGTAPGDAIRWDLGVAEGDDVPTFYDPLVAKVIAAAPTRSEAAASLARELDDTVLLGLTTNRDLLVRVLRDEAFLAGATTTDLLDVRFADPASRVASPAATTVDRAAVVATVVTAAARHRGGVVPTVRPGFANAATFAHEVTYTVGASADAGRGDHEVEARRVRWRVARDGTWVVAVHDLADGVGESGPQRGEVDGVAVVLHDLDDAVGRDVDRRGGAATAAGDVRADLAATLEIDGVRARWSVTRRGSQLAVHGADGPVAFAIRPRFPEPVAEVVAGATVAPMPGTVTTVAVTVGDRVERGAPLCTVEAMKVEHRLTAAGDGEVTEVAVVVGDRVDADAVLVVVASDAPDG